MNRSTARWSALTAAVVAAVLVLYASRSGMVLSPDSMNYALLARSLRAGDGYHGFTGHPSAAFPPVLPSLLALGDLVGLGPESAARLVNAVAAAAAVLLAGRLLRDRAGPFATAGALAWVAGSFVVPRYGAWLLTEPLFGAAVLGLLVLIDRLRPAAARGDGSGRSVVAAAAGALAGGTYLLRYAGLPIVLAGLAGVLVVSSGGARRAGLGRAGLGRAGAYVAGAALVILPFVLATRSYPDGPFSRSYRPAEAGLGDGALRFVRGVGLLVDHDNSRLRTGGVLGAFVVAGVLASAVWTGRRRPDVFRAAAPAWIVLVVYSGFVVVSNLRGGTSLDARILSPMGPLVAVLVATSLSSWWGGRRLPRVLPVLGVVGAVGLLAQSAWVAHQIPGLDSVDRPASPTLAAVRSLPPGTVVASDRPWEIVYEHAADTALFVQPRTDGQSHLPLTADEVLAAACRGPLVFVSLRPGSLGPSHSFVGADIVVTYESRSVQADGALFDVRPLAPCP